MLSFFKNDDYYKLSMKSYIFKRLQAELKMRDKCRSYHKQTNINFRCYYCITEKLLLEDKFETEKETITNALDIIDIINKGMDNYVKMCINLLDECIYDK